MAKPGADLSQQVSDKDLMPHTQNINVLSGTTVIVQVPVLLGDPVPQWNDPKHKTNKQVAYRFTCDHNIMVLYEPHS